MFIIVYITIMQLMDSSQDFKIKRDETTIEYVEITQYVNKRLDVQRVQ